MTRVNLLLLAVLLASCLYLVKNAYESRRLFHALDRARNEQAQLDTEFKRLDAERQAQATHLRGGEGGARKAAHAHRHAGGDAVRHRRRSFGRGRVGVGSGASMSRRAAPKANSAARSAEVAR